MTDMAHIFLRKATEEGEDNLQNVTAQLTVLGNNHIGFSSKRIPNRQVTLVGGRPFSSVG